MSMTFLDRILDIDDVLGTFRNIDKDNPQEAALFRKVWEQLRKDTEMTMGQHQAFNILQDIVEKRGKLRPEMLQNNIFKAVSALGMSRRMTSGQEVTSRIASRYIETKYKEAGAAVNPESLPKPTPWSVPIPWEEARVNVAANINLFISSGAQLKRIHPQAQDYATFVYRGAVFSLSVARLMLENSGNLMTDISDVDTVTKRLGRIFTEAKAIIQSGVEEISWVDLTARVHSFISGRWAALLATGILESLLEYNGLVIT